MFRCPPHKASQTPLDDGVFQWGEQLQPWVISLIKGSYGIKMAEDAQMLQRHFRRWRITDRLMLKQQDGTLGQPGEPKMLEPQANAESDAIHVGDVVHNHYPDEKKKEESPPAKSDRYFWPWISVILLLLAIVVAMLARDLFKQSAPQNPYILEVEKGAD